MATTIREPAISLTTRWSAKPLSAGISDEYRLILFTRRPLASGFATLSEGTLLRAV
jgi:hypothetical protein